MSKVSTAFTAWGLRFAEDSQDAKRERDHKGSFTDQLLTGPGAYRIRALRDIVSYSFLFNDRENLVEARCTSKPEARHTPLIWHRHTVWPFVFQG